MDRLFTRRPELRRQLTFVQVAVPSRSKLESYAAVEGDIDQRVAAINARHAGDGLAGGPIRYRKSALRIRRLVALYRLADFCIVSSLHDGMNLVAKEGPVVNTRDGVLVLSESSGVHHQLAEGALSICPTDIEGTMDALYQAITMSPEDRKHRASLLVSAVCREDITYWISSQLQDIAGLL